MKRLAKLQAIAPSQPTTSSSSKEGPGSISSTSAPPKQKPIPSPSRKPVERPATPPQPPIVKKKPPAAPIRLDLPSWEHATVANVFKVTLDVGYYAVLCDA
jgi:ubiquitin conjugation factor E4 B